MNVVIEIDGERHRLTDRLTGCNPCTACSLEELCNRSYVNICLKIFGGSAESHFEKE